MTSNLNVSESVPEALSDPSSGLIAAVKEWVGEAGDADTEVLLRELNKTVIEQVLETELDHHLGYENTTRPVTVRATTAMAHEPRL